MYFTPLVFCTDLRRSRLKRRWKDWSRGVARICWSKAILIEEYDYSLPEVICSFPSYSFWCSYNICCGYSSFSWCYPPISAAYCTCTTFFLNRLPWMQIPLPPNIKTIFHFQWPIDSPNGWTILVDFMLIPCRLQPMQPSLKS